jgi:hypothetical protein
VSCSTSTLTRLPLILRAKDMAASPINVATARMRQ